MSSDTQDQTAQGQENAKFLGVSRRLSVMAPALRALRIVAAPLALSIIAALLFYTPEQIRELYRSEAENLIFTLYLPELDGGLSSGGFRSVAATLFSVVAVAATLGAAAGFAANRLQPMAEAKGDPPAVWLLLLAPSVAFVLPLIGFLAGVFNAFSGEPETARAIADAFASDTTPYRIEQLIVMQQALLALQSVTEYAALGLLAAILAVGVVYGIWFRNRRRLGGPSDRARFLRRVALTAVALAALATIVWSPVTAPQAIGAMPLICGALVVITFAVTQLSIWSQRTGAPLIVIALGVALLFSAFDLNDNHTIRRIASAPSIERAADVPREADLCEDGAPFASSDEGRCRAGDAFRAWLSARADLPEFKEKGRPYPVYIVAAQGGGAYAAAHTLAVLRRAQARCARFAQHLFAISGVSGGSVGAAFFGAVTRNYSQNAATAECLETPQGDEGFQRSRAAALESKMMSQDFLSPLLGATLGPDLAQRFLPFAVPELSRARALERSFEAVWAQAHASLSLDPAKAPNSYPDPLAQGYLSYWRADGASPALIFNTAESGTGRRRVIAPFHFGEQESDLRFLPLSKERDIPLSAAAALSARFPWVTPAGSFLDRVEGVEGGSDGLVKRRLVDGGYFENSGVATAMALIGDLEAAAAAARAADATLPEIEIHLLVLTTEGFPKRAGHGLGEALEPIRGLLSTRQARTSVEIARAEALLERDRDGLPPRLRRFKVADLATPLPLGWRLSVLTRKQIDMQAGDPSQCRLTAPDWRAIRHPELQADCGLRLIHHELRGDDLDAAAASLVQPEDGS